MAAPKKYPDELRERATRMAVEARRDPATATGAIRRIADQLGIHPEALRTWVKRAEIDAGDRPGTTSEDAGRIADLEREVRELRRANAILKSAAKFLRGGARPPLALIIDYIDQHKHQFGVEPICAAFRDAGVSIAPSTYYAARSRPVSARASRDEEVTAVIRQIHEENYGVYGVRKVYAELARRGGVNGRPVARCTVARLMRAAGLRGLVRGRSPITTRPGKGPDARPDLVQRQFTAPGPNTLWVADITYVRTFAGWVYAAFVLDVFSRRVVGWQLSTSLRTDLALDALEMGFWTRRREGQDVTDLIHHSDKGVQYVAVRYTQRLAEAGAVASVGSTGDSYDNALAEAFNSLFKGELIRNKGPWTGHDDLEIAVAEYIDWYNHRRLHGELGEVPPVEYEHAYRPAAAVN
ncbi:IS3 family transposase [Cryptosporangium minutisporangium]|uniref:IS3 family transposase n=1 Tax=Cryptosporangium minutisporangium TaxID=113569 RepID=UPI0035ED7188